MAGKNGTATLIKARSVDDYRLDMQLSTMSAPQTARFLRLKSKLKQAQELDDFDALADVIDEITEFARARVLRKDGESVSAEEADWCMETLSFQDLMNAFNSSTADAVPPTNGTN